VYPGEWYRSCFIVPVMKLREPFLKIVLLLAAQLAIACGAITESRNEMGGNGDGYPGGDETVNLFAGDYLSVRPEYTCRSDSGRITSHKYKVTVQAHGNIQVSGNGCDNKVVKKFYPWRYLDIAPFNTDYIGRGGAIYVKDGVDKGLFAEALCRLQRDDGTGLDILILTNSDRSVHTGRVYVGLRGPAGLIGLTTPDFVVQRETLSDGISRYTADGLDLTIDRTRLTLERAPGRGNSNGRADEVPSVDFTGAITCRSNAPTTFVK